MSTFVLLNLKDHGVFSKIANIFFFSNLSMFHLLHFDLNARFITHESLNMFLKRMFTLPRILFTEPTCKC